MSDSEAETSLDARRSRAVAFQRFGDADVLEVIERSVPAPGADEIRIRVMAAAISLTDARGRRGDYVDWFYADLEPPYVAGFDAAGVVDAVGTQVSGYSVGDEVMAVVDVFRPSGGAHSEFIVVPAASVMHRPAQMSVEEAATLPMNAVTAFVALDRLDLPVGSTLAVTGGAGWVAAMAIQLAKARGLVVVADANHADAPLVESYGADNVVERGDGLADRILELFPEGVDGMIDTALLGESVFAAVKGGGGIAFLYGVAGDPRRGISTHEIWAREYFQDSGIIGAIEKLAADGKLQGRVAATFPPDEGAAAHRMIEAGGVRGRPVFVFE